MTLPPIKVFVNARKGFPNDDEDLSFLFIIRY